MRGIYGFSGGVVPGAVGDFTHRPIRNRRLPALAIPRTRERNSKKILLAIDHRRNHHRRHRDFTNVRVVKIKNI